MLNMSQTRPDLGGTDEYDLSASAGTFQEGAFMIHAIENGKAVVTPCAGAGGEICRGVAIFYRQLPTTGPVVEDDVVGLTPWQITLQATPVGGKAAMSFVFVDSQGNPGAAVNSGHITVVGNLVTFTAPEQGLTVRMTYVATYTVAMARRLVGDGMYNGAVTPNSPLARVGVIKQGRVATSYFDSSANWNVVGAITLAAGGTVTLAGGGTAIAAVVAQAPNPDTPFLILTLNLI